MRFLVTHAPDPRPSLVVDTATSVDEHALGSLRQALFGFGCANGLLIAPTECVVLRDTFASPDAIVEEARIDTEKLLSASEGPTLDSRVFGWLQAMAASWWDTLSREQTVSAPLLADIVPAVSGSTIRKVA